MSEEVAGRSVGYFEVLRNNQNFRRLWIGRVISQTGDWFNSVALFTLLLSLTGSSESIGYILILKLLPTFFVGPLAGVVADRFNRKTIMIVTDLLRGVLVLGFLLVQSPDQVWLVYVITAIEVVLLSFFEPAESAAVPSIVSREELLSANGLSGASWSVTLAFGAALGGFVTGAFGRNTAFVIDALSFLVSAAYISAVRFPSPPPERGRSEKRLSLAEATGVTDFIEGARYLRSNLPVMALLLVKSGWGLGGGVLLLLTIFGKQEFPLGREGSASIGLLYASRGFGALIGPVIARWITSGAPRTMRQSIGVAFFVSALFYLLVAHSTSLPMVMLFVIGAHAGGSIQWVFSTTLLQMIVPNKFLGRVFALEIALLTLSMSVSTYFTGYGLDHAALSVRQMATIMGITFVIPGVIWFMLQRWLDRVEASNADRAPSIIEAEPATETSFPPP
ncbi:MAG TPA: MFS transporter [Blastocatellia bacterium]|jgi:MFS family permease|nr:MFS transporter [Blastocatellia bacterium]